MSVKIQINSLEALERLIGGDSELEIEMRKSIAYDFTTKHLKSLANDPAVQAHMDKARSQLTETVRVEVEKKLGGLVRTNNYPYTAFAFNTETRQYIDKAVSDRFEEFVKTKVAEAMKVWTPEQINKIVDREVVHQIHTKVRDGVKARLETVQAELTKLPELIKA
jgi:hypothetical protein